MGGISMRIGPATNETWRDKVAFGDKSDALRSSIAMARLWLPARANLVLPGSLLSALMTCPDFVDGTLDPEFVRRFLLEQFDAIVPSGGATWSLLQDCRDETGPLSEMLAVRRSRSRLIGIGQPGLVLPSRAPVQWSLPRGSEPTSAPLRQVTSHAAPEEPVLDLSGLLSVSEVPSATRSGPTPDYSSVVLPALSAALLPREPMAARPTPTSPRRARRRGKLTLGRRVRILAGGAAAVAIALLLPSPTIDRSAPVRVAARENLATLPPWMTRSAVASPILVVSPAGPSTVRVTPALTRETPANPLISASVARQIAAPPRDAAPDSAPVTLARAEPVATVAVRTDAALVAPSTAVQTTVVPRGVAAPTRRRTATKKASVAAVARKRPDVATLVLPDVLKPQ